MPSTFEAIVGWQRGGFIDITLLRSKRLQEVTALLRLDRLVVVDFW